MSNKNPAQSSLRSWAMLASLLLVVAALLIPGTASAASPEQDVPTEDWDRIKQAGKIVVGTSSDYPPFEYYNSNFQLDGFDIALIREMAAEMGLEVEFQDFAFSGLLDALRLGQVDTSIGAISATPDRRKIVDFTNLYYIGDDAALVRNDSGHLFRSPSDFAGKKVGVERGTTFQIWAQENLVFPGVIPQENLVNYESTGDLVADVRSGKIDAALMGYLPAKEFDKRYPDLTIGGARYNSQQFAIAARLGSNLVEPLNDALLKVQASGKYAELVENYLNVDAESVTPDSDTGAVAINTPAPIPTATPGPTATPAPAQCIQGLGYVADLSYDDKGMTAPPVLAPGQGFVKSWRVQNTGTCAWQPDFMLMYVNGNRPEAQMGGQPTPVGKVVQPGETVDISVSLIAPLTYGTFQAYWQMRDNKGTFFGQTVWVGIQVPDPSPPPTPTAVPTPVPPPPGTGAVNPNLRADSQWISSGQCTAIRWDVDNVQAVFFVENGNSMGKGGHDSQTVCPTVTTTYELRVVRNDGVTESFWITINVTGAAYKVNFWADDTDIDKGDCTQLHWETSGVREVYLDGQGVAGTDWREVCPGDDQTYTLLVVRQDGGQEQRQVRIEVDEDNGGDSGGDGGGSSSGPGPKIDWFKVDKNSVGNGDCVTLNWRVSDASGVNIFRSGTPVVQGAGSDDEEKDCPPGPGVYDYRLDAYGHTGNSSQSLTVEVRP